MPLSYQARALETKGYAALGYHFFINADGSVYEGRPLEIMGSHAGRGKQAGALNDPDWGSVGIVLQGVFIMMTIGLKAILLLKNN